MKKKKEQNLFWVSYSDLMTSLFFLLLVMFVVTVSVLNGHIINVENANKKLKKFESIATQFKPLMDEHKHFRFDEKNQMYIAKEFEGVEIFETGSTTIKSKYVRQTLDLGVYLKDFLAELHKENPGFSYLLIIEGNAANTYDHRYNEDNQFWYKRSYDRALAVYTLWNKYKIDLRKYNTEILISGSGFNGLGRSDIEENNKRFAIHILPKVNERDINLSGTK